MFHKNPPHTDRKWFENSMNCDAPPIDAILNVCIDKLWDKYDADASGYLDRDETKVFVNDSILGEKDRKKKEIRMLDDKDDILTDDQFEACFQLFDEN